MAHERTKQALSSSITRAGTAFFTKDEFGAAARKEFDGNRRLNTGEAVEKAFALERALIDRAPSDGRGDRLHDAARLVGLAEAANALACLLCNGVPRRQKNASGGTYVGGSWIDEDEAAHGKALDLIRGSMNEILAKYDARVAAIHGDPRGHVVHIKFADGGSNRGPGSDVWGL